MVISHERIRFQRVDFFCNRGNSFALAYGFQYTVCAPNCQREELSETKLDFLDISFRNTRNRSAVIEFPYVKMALGQREVRSKKYLSLETAWSKFQIRWKQLVRSFKDALTFSCWVTVYLHFALRLIIKIYDRPFNFCELYMSWKILWYRRNTTNYIKSAGHQFVVYISQMQGIILFQLPKQFLVSTLQRL